MSVIISPDLVLPTSSEEPPFPLNHARIGYVNYITEDNIGATSQSAGFPVEALTNPLTYEQWRPSDLSSQITVAFDSPRAVEYVGIAGHNFGRVGAVVKVEYSLDGFTWLTSAELAPGDNSPIMLVFNPVSAQSWRITITAQDTPRIGALNIGPLLAMPRPVYGGVIPISMARITDYDNNSGETGQFLGRSVIRKGIGVSYTWEHLRASWIRETFQPFMIHAIDKPFFIAWNPLQFPREVGYTWTTSDIQPQNMGVLDWMTATLPLRGLGDA